MSRTAPKNAPKSAPKISEPVEGWQSHWLSTYHKPRLVLYRGKWGVAVTKPSPLWAAAKPLLKSCADTAAAIATNNTIIKTIRIKTLLSISYCSQG